jgi:hypothetical protein
MTQRTKPYTNAQIAKEPCFRCGEPARYQWKSCADGVYRPFCPWCDFRMNLMYLIDMGIDREERERKIDDYIKKLDQENGGPSWRLTKRSSK